ncbi:hypothetical protein HWV23_02850 [Natronomonas halophila]|nr:hypothetical protein [Natronomonas halophila]QLD84640.1 hypothetical protein HWV23_02570 [Natronomonas halophila]QLD84695.1 hypothetical protein HWV23_02850 [Natronomonas halophila]
MSRPEESADTDTQQQGSFPVCDTCGCFIVADEQDCPALDDGRCHA